METKRLVGIYFLGILNVISGIVNLLLGLSMNIVAFVSGWLYFILGRSIFRSSFKLKWLFYLVIVPLTILNSLIVFDMHIRFRGTNSPYRVGVTEFIIFMGIPIITCLGNIYFFSHRTT